LQFKRNFTNFIEEQSAAMSELHAPNLLADGSRKGSFFMAEEFAFEQAGRDCGAIHLDERSILALAEAVDGTGDQFFPCPGFTQDQYGRPACRNCRDLLKNLAQCRTAAYNLGELAFILDFPFKIFSFPDVPGEL
jgi:hypothetical protein